MATASNQPNTLDESGGRRQSVGHKIVWSIVVIVVICFIVYVVIIVLRTSGVLDRETANFWMNALQTGATLLGIPAAVISVAFIVVRSRASWEKKADILISYTMPDYRWANWVGWQLQQMGCSVILRDWNGNDYPAMMKKASGSAKSIFAIASLDYLDLVECDPSWLNRLRKAYRSGKRNALICVRQRTYNKLNAITSPQLNLINFTHDTSSRAAITDDNIDDIPAIERLRDNIPGKRKIPLSQLQGEKLAYPGRPTTHWNIDLPHVCFTGRDRIIKEIARDFHQAGKNRLSLYGMKGIGKTEIAIAYAHSNKDRYDYGLYLNMSQATRERDTIEIANRLKLIQEPASPPDPVVSTAPQPDVKALEEKIITWLNTNDRWLLILDECSNPKDVASFIPSTRRGHILAISCENILQDITEPRLIGDMRDEKQEAALLLLRRARIIDPTESFDKIPRKKVQNAQWASKIAEQQGYVPEALKMAALYCDKELDRNLSSFYRLFAENRHRLAVLYDGLRNDGQPFVYTWYLSLEAVKCKNPQAAQLLQFCSFLDPNLIPIDIIKRASQLEPDFQSMVDDDVILNKNIAVLLRFSLIHRDGDGTMLSMNSHVQDILKAGMDDHQRQEFTLLAVRAVAQALPAVTINTMQLCRQYISQAKACIRSVEQKQVLPDSVLQQGAVEVTLLYDRYGSYLRDTGDFDEAEEILMSGLELSRQFHQDELVLASHQSNLAELYYVQGLFDEAEKLYEEILATCKKLPGNTHVQVARACAALAEVFRTQASVYEAQKDPRAEYKLREMEKLCRQALDIWEQTPPEGFTDLARLKSQGRTYYLLKQYKKSEKTFQEAIDRCEEEENLKDISLPEKVICRASQLWSRVGRARTSTRLPLEHILDIYRQAREACTLALEVYKEILGEENHQVSNIHHLLAQVYEYDACYSEALAHYEYAYKIYQRRLCNHPAVQSLPPKIAEMKRRINRY